ncbi:MAG: hypothetical protein CMN28_05130 [Salinisphaeraceae bacterium]|nr:hypothetical protein [Salinisphaeraceae bacterium]
MAKPQLSYAQLLETNNMLQTNGDECYWLCVTRTVQESKLFPVPSYMLLSYLNCFYRYPGLLAKIEEKMSAEEIGDRMRNMGVKIANPSMGWGLTNFYLLGREWLIAAGLLRPQDAADDVMYVMDFWKRYQLAWHRNDGHLFNKEFDHRGQFLPERQLQVFHADLYDCQTGDELHEAAHQFLAAASQYCFLIACESRLCLHTQGPYKIDDQREMIVRDHFDLSECSLPWLDGVGAEVPYNNLTVTMAVDDCHFHICDDWGSTEAEPEFKADKLSGIGLYTSDMLSEGYIPVGMNSREELTQTFHELAGNIKDATAKLWQRIAGWSRDQMMDAGAITYYACIKDLAHVAGVYDVDDWMKIDHRADRFRPLFNDEYGRDCLGEMVGLISLPQQQISDYSMMMHSNAPKRVYTPIPYDILKTGDYVPSVGDVERGITYLPEKEDRYNTTQGTLTLSEFNRKAADFVPETLQNDRNLLCETWVKFHYDSPQADDLYKVHQKHSRLLKDRGAGLRRADIEKIRSQE